MGPRRVAFALVLVITAALVSVAPAGAQTPSEPLASCFWEGPVSMKRPSSRGYDGHFFNFPEQSATYWIARFALPAGTRLGLTGRYAHARYQSLNAYSDGAPIDALADIQTAPDPGATNPFAVGNRRDLPERGYAVSVVDQPPPASGRAANTLYAGADGNAPIELAYRVYEPDRGRDLDGGTGLPEPVLTRPDGSVVRGAAACAAINDPDRSIPMQPIAPQLWQAGRNAPGCDGRTNPAYSPVRWERFFSIDYAQLAVPGDCTTQGRQARLGMAVTEKGGFYSNRDNAYIYAHLSRKFGPVLVVEAKVPTVPRTFDAQPTMEASQLRYWSLCTGESRVTLRTPDCVADRELPVDRDRRYVVAISQAADRPANAREACGIAWVDWGDRGDGAGDPDYAVLIMRHMLPAADFAQAIQRVVKPGQEADVMGEYFPATTYVSKRSFEGRGCRESRLELRGDAVRADRDGKVRVRVACTTREATCLGTLALSSAGRSVGRAPIRLRAGQARNVVVKLTRRPRVGRTVRAIATGATPVGVALSAQRDYRVRR